jgi:peptidoglycan/xylan/chitin deacetylase (PgdA/CDA1 family)
MQLLIINHHYIRDKKYKNGIYPKSLKDLEKNIEILHKRGYKFVSQNELINIKKGEYVLFTFDDGLKEQMEAFEFLLKKGIPAVFYVSTYPIMEKKVLNVHKLHYIRSKIDDKELLDFISKFVKDVKFPENLNELYRYDNFEAKKVKYIFNFMLKDEIKTEIINKLFIKLTDETKFSEKLYMNEEDIIKLYKYGCLGTHTHKHLPLATLKENEILNEISQSLEFFKKLGLNNIYSISYPYGGKKAVNRKVVNISKKFFKFGLTMYRGINNGSENLLELKRIDVNDIKEYI